MTEQEQLARKGRELRDKRHSAPDSLEIRPRRLLIGIGIGLLALAAGFAVFMGIQQYRLRQCIPLIESSDPATKQRGVWRALDIRVYFGDRRTTRAIVRALPSLPDSEEKEIILGRLSYWEGRRLAGEDVPLIARSLASPNEREVASAAALLGKMGKDAAAAVPDLEAALKRHGDPEGPAHEPIKRALAAIKAKAMPR